MSLYRGGEARRVVGVLRAVTGEAVRSPLIRVGWLILTVLGLVSTWWFQDPVEGAARGRLFFLINYSLVCCGDAIAREYRSRRALLFVTGGTGHATHFLGTAGSWILVYLAGSWLFGALTLGMVGLSWQAIARGVLVLLSLLPVLALGYLLSVILRGWSNVAVLLLGMLILRLVAEYSELFGAVSIVAQWLIGRGERPVSCVAPGSGATGDAAAWLYPLVDAVVRGAVLLALGALLAKSRWGRSRLGAAAVDG